MIVTYMYTRIELVYRQLSAEQTEEHNADGFGVGNETETHDHSKANWDADTDGTYGIACEDGDSSVEAEHVRVTLS